jgi:hypothetical protein
MLFRATSSIASADWSADGRFILFSGWDPTTDWDLWAFDLLGDEPPVTVVRDPLSQREGTLSPGGRWMAYSSNESGRFEVYVSSFPTAEGKWQISTDGGWVPRWPGDGLEIFYLTPGGKLMAVEIQAGAEFEAGLPKELFEVPIQFEFRSGRRPYDVTADGEHFIVNTVSEDAASSHATVVLNWTAELEK